MSGRETESVPAHHEFNRVNGDTEATQHSTLVGSKDLADDEDSPIAKIPADEKAAVGKNDLAGGKASTGEMTSADEEKNRPANGDNAVSDPNIVDWDGPDDPTNPRNWSRSKKLLNIALVSLSVLYTNIATTMFAPGASKLASEFGVTSIIVMTLTVTIPSLGASLGPLLFAPLSELTGRVPIYQFSSALFLGCTIGCALSTDVAMFLVFRFLCGACSASFMTCGGGTIADLLAKEHRGAATAMFTAGPLLGPVIGPVIGGFVTQSLSWRWTFYLVLIFAAIVTTIAIITMRETNAVMILSRKTARLRKETGNPDLRPARERQIPAQELVKRALIRPIHMLLLSPIVMLIGLYMAFVFGMTYLLFATFPTVFENTYGWRVGVSGLAYLGLGVGCTIGVILFSKLSDKLLSENGGPERRLILMIFAGPCVPISIFWYGWSAEAKVHWIVPIIGTVFIGVGTICVTSSGQLYMMDMFGPQGAASALAATTLVRNGSGAFLALAADPLYNRFGLGWGNSVLGFISLVFIPVPVLFYWYGPWLREKFPVKL